MRTRTLGVWSQMLINYRAYEQVRAIQSRRNTRVSEWKKVLRYGMGKGVRIRIACHQHGVHMDIEMILYSILVTLYFMVVK